ncbi:MAG: hypothetical protein ACXVAY_09920 [Mucilaginibacter sp.]
MENAPLVAGIFCLTIGIYIGKAQIRRLRNPAPGKSGFNFRLMLYGIAFIIAGIILVLRRF